jgi:protoporphyrinogen oxidase
VLTTPCPHIASACPQLSESEKARLDAVVYQGVVCASLLLRRPLAGYYVTNLTDASLPFTGVIEMTSLVGVERFGGHSLVYLPRYLTQDDPYWQRDDADVRADFLAGLTRMYPDLREDDVLAFEVSRVRSVMAVSTLRYSTEVLPPLRTSVPNVFVVNSSQIANGTLNVNETVGLANAKAAELSRLLGATRVPAQDGGSPRLAERR